MNVLTRIALLFSIITGLSISNIKAQQPGWVDYQQRQLKYPESEFLVGFVSGSNTKNEDPEKLMNSYEALAKEKVLQSIIVSIETNNEYVASNVNGKSNEEFLSKTVSISKAKINGLRSARYYDKKNNQVYALVYVNIKELVFYYKNLISSNLITLKEKQQEGREYLGTGDKENALRSFYEGMPLLSQIEEAQMLLIALNKKMMVDQDMGAVMNIRRELNKEIHALQQSKELNMSEAAYFVAYGLFVQIKEIDSWISLSPFSYENTDLSSSFSSKWQDDLSDALVKAGKYTIKDISTSTENGFVVGGNYWQEGDNLRIQARATRHGEIQAVSQGTIPIVWLKGEKISYVPSQMEKINLLKEIKLKAINASQTEKRGKASSSPLEVQVMVMENSALKPLSNVPVKFVLKQTGKVLCHGNSNEQGVAQGFLPGIQASSPIVEIDALVDIATFADLDTNTAFYALVNQQNTILPASFQITMEHQLIYLISNEILGRYPLEIKTIEPVIKQYFSDKGYYFTGIPDDADYTIHVEASTTTGNVYNGIYFSFVDANLSIVEQASGDEVFKTHIDQVKGGGSDFSKAGKKAFVITADKLKEKLQTSGF